MRNGLIVVGTWLWRWLFHRYLFTASALLLTLLILFYLPQVRNVLWQLPRPWILQGQERWLAWLFYAFCASLLVFYAVLAQLLVPRTPGTGWSPARLGHGGWERIDPHVPAPQPRRWWLSWVPELLVRLAEWTPWWLRRAVGVVLLASGSIGFVGTKWFQAGLSSYWRTVGLSYGTAMALLGLWLAVIPRDVGRYSSRSPGESGGSDRLGFKSNLIGRALLLLFLSEQLGELLWRLPDWYPDLVSYRVYTIWAVFDLIFWMTTAMRVIDACHVYSRWNIRALSVLGTTLWLASMPTQPIGQILMAPPENTRAGGPIVMPMDTSTVYSWFGALEDRLRRLPPDGPAVFVAASGGGSRAALFTALVLEGMHHTRGVGELIIDPQTEEVLYQPQPAGPMDAGPMLPGSAPPKLAPAPSARLFRPATLADHVVLISSVSGGSLATACYLNRNFPHTRRPPNWNEGNRPFPHVAALPRTRPEWQNSYRGELYLRMRERTREMLKAIRAGQGEASRPDPNLPVSIQAAAAECEALVEGRMNGPYDPNRVAPWLSTSALADDMSTDFMAPLLRGIITPGLERGESVTRFWEDRFGWRDVSDTSLHMVPRGEIDIGNGRKGYSEPFNGAPLALFNACDVEQGSRLVLGFPPLPAGLITDRPPERVAKGPYTIADRGDFYYSVNLAEAVRLSANFPWGFEVAHLPLKNGADTVMVLDGGIVDNSGVDTITHLIQGLDRLTAAWDSLPESQKARLAMPMTVGGPPASQEMMRRAAYVMTELRRRGILLVQIDSGTKDLRADGLSVSSLLAKLAPALFRPIQALNNTSYTNADLAAMDHEVVLRNVLDPDRFHARRRPAVGGSSAEAPPPAPAPPAYYEPTSAPDTGPTVPAAPAPAVPDVSPPDVPPPDVPQTCGGPPPQVPEAGPAPQPGQIPVTQPVPPPQPPMQPVYTPPPQQPVYAPPPQYVPFSPPGSLSRPPLIWTTRLTCNHSENVMTAWTLGPEDKAQVLVQFLVEWANQKEILEQSLRAVQSTAWAYRNEQDTNAPEEVRRLSTEQLAVLAQQYDALRKGQRIRDLYRSDFYSLTGNINLQAPQMAPPPQAPMFAPGIDDDYNRAQSTVDGFRAKGVGHFFKR
jgi:hypothetical protein